MLLLSLIDKLCVCMVLLDLSICICVIHIVFILCPWLIWVIFVNIDLREMRLIAIDNDIHMSISKITLLLTRRGELGNLYYT